MKKLITVLCIAAVLANSAFLTGCNSGSTISNDSNSLNNPENSSAVTDDSGISDGSDNTESSDNPGVSNITPEPGEPVDIDSLPVKHIDWGDIFDDPVEGSFEILERFGGSYFGYGYSDDCESLKNVKTGTVNALKFPENFPRWVVGSGAYVTLGNRYYYEWRAYVPSDPSSGKMPLKLTRTDGVTGEVTVADETEAVNPFVYLVKLDDNSFLSYAAVRGLEGDDYTTLTAASIYYSDGTKKDIISEKYTNEADWTDSVGILNENFAVKDGEIYGFGRRNIGGEYKFFLYHYDRDGNLLDTVALPGMENIMGSESAIELYFAGDYLIFRTHQSLTRYICRITDNGVTPVVKGSHYAVSGSRIFFIESTVDPDTDQVKDKNIPLYFIDTASDEITAVNFDVPVEKPYFVALDSLSNGDLMFKYCKNGKYDPSDYTHFILPIGEVNALINEQ